MIRVILFISIIIFSVPSFGDVKGDSLLHIYDTATSKHKIIALNNAINYFMRIAPTQAVDLSNQALILMDKYSEDTLLTADVLRLCSSAFFSNNQLDKSMTYAIKALELQKQIGDSVGMIRTLNILAICYSSMNKFEKALDFHQNSLELSKKFNDSTYIATGYNNIANIYDRLNQPDLALQYSEKALEIRKHLNRPDLLAVSFNNVGELLRELNKLQKAKSYFLKALDLLEKNNYIQYKSFILLNLADLYQKLGEQNKSAKYYSLAEQVAKATNNYTYLLDIYTHLSDIAKRNKQYKKALTYSNKAISVKDTLMKKNIHIELNKLRLQYDQKQTLLENQKLKNDNDKKQLKIEKEHIYVNTLTIIVFLIIVILFLLIKRFKANNNNKLENNLRKQVINSVKQNNEIKRLKLNIQETKNTISQFLNIFTSPVFIINPDNNIEYTNSYFNKEFDIQTNKITNIEADIVFEKSKLTSTIKKIISGIEKEIEFTDELSVFSSESKTKNITLKRVEYSNNKFGVIGIIDGVSNDNLKTQILLNENRFRNFANQLPEMIFEINLKGNITFANKKALKIFDVTKQDLDLGLKIYDLIPEKTREDIKSKLEIIFKNKPETTFGESELITKNGKVISVLIHIYALKVNDEVYGFRGILIDITQQKNKVEELRKAEEKAINADKSKSLFLQNLSHEIRTPMNGIVGFSEILKNENLSKEDRDAYIDIIINSSNQLLGIIDDIINISKIETGELKIEEKEISISEFFNNLMMFFHVYISNRKNNISIRLANKINPKFDKAIIAEKQVRMIFNNLIGNAIKYTSSGYIEFGGKITENNEFEFYVTDTGIGIDQKYHKLIFERFTQINKNDKNLNGGTGLGLTISKAMVEQMGGKIWVESNDDRGTTFYFSIPYKPAKEIKKTKEDTDKNIPNWSNYHFLIVEDDLNNYIYLEQVLIKTKVKITHSSDGNEALKLLQEKHSFDLILMDIQLPGINGLKIVETIRKQGDKTPVIAQTANAMIEDKEESLSVGCNDYIAKPINKWVLLSKIEQLFKTLNK